jgi:hypothetical protein
MGIKTYPHELFKNPVCIVVDKKTRFIIGKPFFRRSIHDAFD